jgi:glycosyltransferase involved in cell wall biosynthesis
VTTADRRLKLLIISHACALAENQRLFALAASRRNWDVTLVIPKVWMSEYGRPLEATLIDGFDARLISIPVLNNGKVPLHLYRTRPAKLIKSIAPDIIYSHNEPYAFSTIQWCLGNRQSVNVPFGFFSCQNILKRYPVPFRQAERWVYRNSQFAFPITQTVNEVHRTKGFSGDSTILPLGFDASLFPVSQRDAIAADEFRFAYLGRVVEEKGLLTLVKALASLPHRQWRLEIFGSGPFEAVVKRKADELGIDDRLNWRGFVPQKEIATRLAQVDAVVLPSETRGNWKEQFGRVLIESLASGVPVVGSDSGEIPIILRESGGGLIFSEGNVESCAVALQMMMTDHEGRKRMAEDGARFVREKYDLSNLADRFARKIERIAGVSNARGQRVVKAEGAHE